MHEYALEGSGTNMPWRGEVLNWYLLNHESIYALVHLPSLVRIEPELHHTDSPTYTTLPCQAPKPV
jgi:hypothetical protein